MPNGGLGDAMRTPNVGKEENKGEEGKFFQTIAKNLVFSRIFYWNV